MESKKEVVGNFEPTENVKLLAEAQYLLIESNKRQSELIAQRDELLAALKPIMEQLDDFGGEITSGYEPDEYLLHPLRVAIAKCEVKS